MLTLPANTWQEATCKSQPLQVLAEAPWEQFCKSFLFWPLVQQSYYNTAGSRWVQDSRAKEMLLNPKAIEEETSQWMLICPLCHNVTKILMIKSHNLRYRINGFDVCLLLLPSHHLPTPTRCGSKGQGSRTRGKELHTGPLENTHSNAHSRLQI